LLLPAVDCDHLPWHDHQALLSRKHNYSTTGDDALELTTQVKPNSNTVADDLPDQNVANVIMQGKAIASMH
jgi:hypothetical protein